MKNFTSIFLIAIYKLIYGYNLKVNFFQKWCYKTLISIKGKSYIRIGKDLLTRRNVTLKVFDGGSLIIKDNCFFNENVSITALESIEIGNNVNIGNNVVIIDHNHDYKSKDLANKFVSKKIVIEDNVWIGANSVILMGSIIKEGSVIAAGSIVNKTVSSNTLFIQKRKSEENKYV